MGKKKEKQVKEKPLDKMTAKELRELALKLEGIVGVHAMNKAELIAAIKQAKGIADESTKQKAVDVRALKVKIRELRRKRDEAKEAGNTKLADAFRRRISNLKKKTRRAA
ncbi:MAG: Rho termination factor N-terminal domain-containing protein [Desulfosoma sp.]